MPIEGVWGIGRKWSKKLNGLGLLTALDLSHEEPEAMRQLFNKILAATVSELQGTPVLEIETIIEPKKNIVSSRSFGQPVTKLSDLKESVSSHMARALEKLRAQGSVAKRFSVFIQTNRFHSGFQGYHYQQDIELTNPSQNNQDFLKAALAACEKLFHESLAYKKAGIVLSEISQKGAGQFDLFAERDEKQDEIVLLMDALNKKLGSGTLRYAVEGFQKKWQMRSSKVSKRFTTRWDELPIVKAGI